MTHCKFCKNLKICEDWELNCSHYEPLFKITDILICVGALGVGCLIAFMLHLLGI